jgi:hypothetical protein
MWQARCSPRTLAGAVLLLSFVPSACDHGSPLDSTSTGAPSLSTAAPPSALVSIPVGNGTLSIWPYTGGDFSGTPQDPINLVFAGHADPREIRNALFGLDGDRTGVGFPNAAPFNCTWTDAIGDIQTAYGEDRGWTGSAIQLACGDFGPVRVHLRLFQAGPVTLGGAHFELLIPGTTDHQVLSWELAEQLITADMARSGLLAAAPAATGIINDAPTFREIPQVIYNLLPVELRAAIGGPLGDVSAPVGIATDGRASRFDLGGVAPAAGGTRQHFVIEYDQVVPRPFCGPGEYLFLQGPVDLRKDVRVSPSGALVSEFHASARLQLTPVDPSTGTPTGESYGAEVSDQQVTRYDDSGGQAEQIVKQTELPQGEPGRGRRSFRLKVGPAGVTLFDQNIVCHP